MMCLRKHRYATKAEAGVAATEAGARYGIEFRVYRCPYCSEWHITSEPFDYERFKGKPARSLWSNANTAGR